MRQEHIQGKLHTQGSILRIKEGQMLILRALIIIIQKETLTIKGELKNDKNKYHKHRSDHDHNMHFA